MEGMEGLKEKVQYGHTKVFLKAGQLAKMEELRTDKISRASMALQRYIRRFNAESHFLSLREATLLTQRGTP